MQSKWIPICIPWCSQWNMHLWRLVAKTMAFMEFASLPMGWMLRRNFDSTPHCIFAYLHICGIYAILQYASLWIFACADSDWLAQQMKYGDWWQLATKLWLGFAKCAFLAQSAPFAFQQNLLPRFFQNFEKHNLAFGKPWQSKRVCCEKHKNAMYGGVKQTQSAIGVDAVDNFAGTLAAMMRD